MSEKVTRQTKRRCNYQSGKNTRSMLADNPEALKLYDEFTRVTGQDFEQKIKDQEIVIKKLKRLARNYKNKFQKMKDIADCKNVISIKACCNDATKTEILCAISEDGRLEIWVPRNVIDVGSDVYDVGDQGDLVICSHWAYTHGLITV